MTAQKNKTTVRSEIVESDVDTDKNHHSDFLREKVKEREKQLRIQELELEKEYQNRSKEFKERERALYLKERELEEEFRERLNNMELEAKEREHKFKLREEMMERDFQNRLQEHQLEARERENLLVLKEEQQKQEFRERFNKLQEDLKARENEQLEREVLFRKERDKLLHEMELLEEEKAKYEKEGRQRIESNAPDYINSAVDLLATNEMHFQKKSNIWTIIGFISIFLAILTAIFFSLFGINKVSPDTNVSWEIIFYVSFKGLLIISLFIAMAKYSFTFGKSYMHESLKNGERKHAINFGKFYLQAYGVSANWSEIKEVFEHWNISNTTAFSNVDTKSFDPQLIEKITNLIKTIKEFNFNKSKSEQLANDN